MPPNEGKPEDVNPSIPFRRNFLHTWKTDPVGFVDNLFSWVDPSDRLGYSEEYVLEAIENGEIDSAEFDEACFQWLQKVAISKIKEDFDSKLSLYPVAYRLKDVLMMAASRPGNTIRFPKALSWFRENKAALLAIQITHDGGHWGNGLKRVLNEWVV